MREYYAAWVMGFVMLLEYRTDRLAFDSRA
jgi:hypothetical protein